MRKDRYQVVNGMNREEVLANAIRIAETSDMGKIMRRKIKAYADAHQLTMEQKGLPDETDDSSLVHKGFNPVGKTWLVEKAWLQSDGTLAIEGWVSTNHPDLEKDVVEPEAFYGETFESYYARSAPLSSNHDTDGYPIGHLQKGVLVRDGVIFQEEYHPTDPAEFTNYNPATKGTGWYGRGVITDERVASHVHKGNMGAFSWIGNLKAYEPLVGGGKRYHTVDPLIESTVAAYPVNPKAVMQIAKAYGLSEQGTKMPNTNPERDPLDLEAMLLKAGEIAAQKAKEEAALAMKGTVTAEQLGDLLLQFEQRMSTKVEQAVTKAAPTPAAELETEETVGKGIGRKSTQAADPREDNPVKYIVNKGRIALAAKKEPEYDEIEKQTMWELTRRGLAQGMQYTAEDASDFGDN